MRLASLINRHVENIFAHITHIEGYTHEKLLDLQSSRDRHAQLDCLRFANTHAPAHSTNGIYNPGASNYTRQHLNKYSAGRWRCESLCRSSRTGTVASCSRLHV